MACKHKYIDTKDGSRDKYCPVCGKKAKQGVMYLDKKKEIVINVKIDMENISIDEISKKIIEQQINNNRKGIVNR